MDKESNSLPLLPQEPWYREGLSFKCTGCGKCCTGSPGIVFVNDDEIKKIAAHLGLSEQQFANHYLRKIGPHFSLKERMPSYDCIFLKDNQCAIYSHRPMQCRTFPFWPRILQSQKEWEDTAKSCEGINACAPIVAFDQIEQERLKQTDYDDALGK